MARRESALQIPNMKSILAAGSTLALLYGGCSGGAYAQGGQTAVSKTVPSNPQPAPQPQAAPGQPGMQQQPQVAPDQPGAPAAAAPSPMGGGAQWQAGLDGQPSAAPQQNAPQDASALEVVEQVNTYFNTMKSLQGSFVQTDPDNAQKKGKFYFERPGKVRFDYGSPSKLKIISDGKYLAIEDHDLQTTDRYPLEMTPFRLLLSETVNLAKDARILAVDQGPEVNVVTMEDATGNSGGKIRLFFSKANANLSEWIITDPQGLDTRIQVSNLDRDKDISPDLFKFSNVGFKALNQ